MKKIAFFALIFSVSLFTQSCNKVKNTAKKSLNKGGEIIGKSATEIIDGVGDGIQTTTQSKLILDDELVDVLKTGTFNINKPFRSDGNSQLSVYFIHLTDIDNKLLVKAFNDEGVEIGRARTQIKNKKDEAGYYDFNFDPRTKLNPNSTFKISISE